MCSILAEFYWSVCEQNQSDGNSTSTYHPQAVAQQFDVGFGAGTVLAPSASSATGDHSPQTLGGGTYLNFSGDYLFRHNFELKEKCGVPRRTQVKAEPFRPIFYDFNAIWPCWDGTLKLSSC